MRHIALKISLVSIFLSVLAVPALVFAHTSPGEQADLACDEASLYCPLSKNDELAQELESLPSPALTGPVAPQVSKPVTRTVTYDVITRGAITADLAQFKAEAKETFNDSRGWRRLGVQFTEVASGGDFTLALAEAAQVPSFNAAICSADYSCSVGRYVIINQDRWLGATPAWNGAGGSLRDYRHMVVNHETGHWLGHGHQNCKGAGQAAPVMQQQSIDLQGCTFNPWPIDSEIWSSRLGI